MVSRTPRPHFAPGKDPVPILQEAGWAPGPVWTSEKSDPHGDSIPDRPARSSVAVPTELPGPLNVKYHCQKANRTLNVTQKSSLADAIVVPSGLKIVP